MPDPVAIVPFVAERDGRRHDSARPLLPDAPAGLADTSATRLVFEFDRIRRPQDRMVVTTSALGGL